MNVNKTAKGLTCGDSERTVISAGNVELPTSECAQGAQSLTPLTVTLTPTGYRELRPIGSGGTSLVYSAVCEVTGWTVALKQLRSELAERPQSVLDFLQEPRILLGLRHPNIIRCMDFFFDCDTWWIVLEYLPEGSLKSHMRCGSAGDQDQTESWMSQIASALTYLHGKGLVHGDVKPGNILLDGKRAVLADFGYCSALNSNPSSPVRVCGTVGYMSEDALQGIRSYGNDWYGWKKSGERLGIERSDIGRGKA